VTVVTGLNMKRALVIPTINMLASKTIAHGFFDRPDKTTGALD
jgi:hypothetical protein